MISLRLARLIETHSGDIIRELVSRIQTSPHTVGMRNIPDFELQAGTREVLQHLREWLLTKTDADLQARYRQLGGRWARQGVALHDCCWTLVLTKDYLWEFLQKQASVRNAVEIYGEMELLVLLNQFFDRALCHLVEGYEQVERVEARQSEGPGCPQVNLAAWVP